LPKIGAHARRYFLTGERFDAEAARHIGLVHEISAEPDAVVDELVAAILSGGPEAIRAAKLLIRGRPAGVETARIAAERRTSDEGQEGLRAFLDRRKASFVEDRGG
jgi:methylglutaconyl-CoA hydratase